MISAILECLRPSRPRAVRYPSDADLAATGKWFTRSHHYRPGNVGRTADELERELGTHAEPEWWGYPRSWWAPRLKLLFAMLTAHAALWVLKGGAL